MSNDTTTENGTTNGKPAKQPSKLDTLAAEFEKNHKGKTSAKRAAELVKAYQTAIAARKAAEEKVQATVDAERKAAEAIIREASGKSRVTMGGVNYMPMSRTDSNGVPYVFFRRESAGSVDLGG